MSTCAIWSSNVGVPLPVGAKYRQAKIDAERGHGQDGTTRWTVSVYDGADGPIVEAVEARGSTIVVCTGIREWGSLYEDVLEKARRFLDAPDEWKARTVRECEVDGCGRPLPMWGGGLRNCLLPDECLVCATRTVVACVECGDPDPHQCTTDRERRLAEQVCGTCDFWRMRLRYHGEPKPNHVVTDGWVCYSIGDGRGSASCRGFGGAKFTVRFHDGRTVETEDLWYGGIVPERFRDRFTPNAQVIGSGASAPGGRKFVGDPTR